MGRFDTSGNTFGGARAVEWLCEVAGEPTTLATAKKYGIDEEYYKTYKDDIIRLVYDYISGDTSYSEWYPSVDFNGMDGFLLACHITEWDEDDPFALNSDNQMLLATFAFTEAAYVLCYGFLDLPFPD